MGGKIIVTAGNTVIGLAGKHNELAGTVNGIAPQLTPVTGTVTRVLTKTGQTLVNIGNGNTLVLGKAGGQIGDLLKIDLGSKTVIGAPSGSPLLGVGVLSGGNIATVNVGKNTDALGAITKPLTTTVSGIATPQTGPATGATGAVGGVVSKTTGVVGGLLGGLKGKK